MLKINFYPESDLEGFKESIKEFEDIWRQEGEKITSKWEKITQLRFKESEISAIVADLRSCSHPLTLRYDNESDIKKSTLIHELGHRILFKRAKNMKGKTLERHKFLYLVLYDVFLELYGEEYTNKVIKWDSHLGKENGQLVYKEAWEWVLQFKNKGERQRVFKEILSGDYEF